MASKHKYVVGTVASVVISSATGYVTNVATNNQAWTWTAALVGLVVALALLTVHLSKNQPASQQTAELGTGPGQHAAATGKARITQAGNNVTTGVTGWVMAAIVAILVAGGVALAAINAPPVTPLPSNGLPFDIKVLTDPAKFEFGKYAKSDAESLNTVSNFYFPPGKLFSSPKPPKGLSCSGWHAWAYRHGGMPVDWSNIALNISAIAGVTVQIIGAELNIKRLPPPQGGDIISCEQGDETSVSYLELDLNTGQATYRYKGVEPVALALTVSPSAPERMYVRAEPNGCYCEWFLTFHILVNGKEYIHRIDNNGQPFKAAGGGLQGFKSWWIGDGEWISAD